MLSYQHGYHAGCFADVIKHVALTRLIHYLIQKDKPLFYLDTHSGRGRYDLKDKQALKTGEALTGINLVWDQREQIPAVFSLYLDAIRQLNPHGGLRYYPGSPELAIQNLRGQDRLVFCELHHGEFGHLDQLPHQGRRVFCRDNDGLMDLQALLPPIERRGLIMIDPSYEVKTEYRDVPNAVKAAYKKFSTGVYCVWYPIIDNKLHAQLIRGLTTIESNNALRIEFNLNSKLNTGMAGCGLWIINAPYTLAEEMKTALQTLRQLFNPGASSYLIEKG
ncbi:23S rRNA (adenine(2030)-N(6))-methyltransferase RlmJ [bacterium]|nr:23S rRNA (adenine(2030)-N(6))-methyltransferase RlmJ [bacterium]